MAHDNSPLKTLDFSPITITKGHVRCAMTLSDEFVGAEQYIHGGLMTIILDTIFGMTVFTTLKTMTPIATVSLRTDQMAPAIPGARVVCDAQWLGAHNDIAHMRGDIRDAETDLVYATASGAFMIGTRGPAQKAAS